MKMMKISRRYSKMLIRWSDGPLICRKNTPTHPHTDTLTKAIYVHPCESVAITNYLEEK